jgi:hypothetical protein
MNREALKARHVDAQGASIVLEGFFGSSLFRAFALRHVAIAAPGPLGRAITFRAFGA